jgi:hypothetical protein
MSYCVSRKQCLLLLMLVTCTEAFARLSSPPAHRSYSRDAAATVKSSRRNVLQAPKTSSSSSSSGSMEEEDESDEEQQQRNNFVPKEEPSDTMTTTPTLPTFIPKQQLPQIIIPNDDIEQTPTCVEFVAETKLPTDLGAFQLRAYRVPDDGSIASKRLLPALGGDPCVIYARDRPPFGQSHVPVRIHDQCLTSEVFRSQRYVQEGAT